MSFFGINSPRAMLDKAEWNYAQFKADPTIYRLADFFISAHHIQDYMEKDQPDTKAPPWLRAFTDQQDIKDCRDLCDVSKHYKLTNRGRVTPETFTLTGEVCGAEIGVLEIGAGDKWVMTTAGNREIDVIWLADRVMQKWRELFAQQGL